jgi:hypothetical protein
VTHVFCHALQWAVPKCGQSAGINAGCLARANAPNDQLAHLNRARDVERGGQYEKREAQISRSRSGLRKLVEL